MIIVQVLNEDLRLVLGQQERMINGANIWNWPVSYDKLGIRYRLWRDAVERGSDRLPFSNQAERGPDRLPFSNQAGSGS
jgi:chlorophyllide a oxygenase